MLNKPLQKRVAGKEVLSHSALYEEIHVVKRKNEQLVMEMNSQYHTKAEMLQYLEKITETSIDSSVIISQPFYSDFGNHIVFGKNIFINQNVTFVDLGGITLEDEVLIGPCARLITVNHLMEPENRRGIKAAPIHVKRNAWIGSNATILPGITIGENAIVAADATVTKDVPANVIVAGSPAKEIRKVNRPYEK